MSNVESKIRSLQLSIFICIKLHSSVYVVRFVVFICLCCCRIRKSSSIIFLSSFVLNFEVWGRGWSAPSMSESLTQVKYLLILNLLRRRKWKGTLPLLWHSDLLERKSLSSSRFGEKNWSKMMGDKLSIIWKDERVTMLRWVNSSYEMLVTKQKLFH